MDTSLKNKKYIFVRRLESGLVTGGSEIVNSYISSLLQEKKLASNAVYLTRYSTNSEILTIFNNIKLFLKLTYGKLFLKKYHNIDFYSTSLDSLIKKIESEENNNVFLIFLNAADYTEIAANYPSLKFYYICQHTEFWDIDFIQFREVVQSAQKVICVSDYLYQICQSLLDSKNVLLLKNHRVHSVPIEKTPVNLRIYDFIFFISHHYWKGYKDSLHCINFLREKYPDFRICAFGTNEDLSLKKHLQDLKINYFTHIKKNKVLDLFLKSKVFVYLSHFEGYGLPALEALDCGTYVLSYDNYGINTISSKRLKVVGHRDLETLLKELPLSIIKSETIKFEDIKVPSLHENTDKFINFLQN